VDKEDSEVLSSELQHRQQADETSPGKSVVKQRKATLKVNAPNYAHPT
jgi:hypothetical protein